MVQNPHPPWRGGAAGVNCVPELPASQNISPIKPMSAIFRRGGLRCGRHAPAARRRTDGTGHHTHATGRRVGGIAALETHGRARPVSRASPNGGNCSIRAATRRRHADRMLLMVQNPHHYPWCHAPTLVSCSLTVVTLSHWCGAARRDADKRQKGVTDRTVAGERATNSTTGLVPIRQNTPSVIIQPVLIGRNALDQVESSLTGRMPPNGSKAPDQESSSRWCASCLRRCGVSVLARHSSLDDARDRAATNTL